MRSRPREALRDRPVTIIVKEFALKWSIPEPSVYKALSKLDNLGIIQFKRGKVTVEWNLSNPTPNYQDGQKIINFDNLLSDPIENETPQPLSDKGSSSPQTIQTCPNPQTAGGGKINPIGFPSRRFRSLSLSL